MSIKNWMVRAGEGGFLFEEFQKYSVIAIGWNEIGKLEASMPLKTIKEKIRDTYPELKNGQVISSSNQIYKFLIKFSIDDNVVSYNKETRKYLIGKITSDYFYNQNTSEYFNPRKVDWVSEKSRDELEIKSKNSLGSTLTIFEINDDVFKDLTRKKIDSVVQTEEDFEEIRDDVIERAHEFIKDKLSTLSWDLMQDYVGTAKGYGIQNEGK